MMTEADLALARMRLSDPEHLHPDESYELACDLVDEVDRLRAQRDFYNEQHLRAEAGLAAALHTEVAAVLSPAPEATPTPAPPRARAKGGNRG